MDIMLNEENIDFVIKNPKSYKNENLIINGENVKNSLKLFSMKIEMLVANYRHYPFTLTIENPYRASNKLQTLIKAYFPEHIKSISFGYCGDNK